VLVHANKAIEQLLENRTRQLIDDTLQGYPALDIRRSANVRAK
jgi:hypothetical protein